MDPSGQVVATRHFSTSEKALIQQVTELPEKRKFICVEECNLAGWIAEVLRPHVTDLIVCDPLQNLLIHRGHRKDDLTDAINLSRLLR